MNFITTAEGRADNVDGISKYSYSYNLTDHLGNVRVTEQRNTANWELRKVAQEDEYYSFGLRVNKYSLSTVNNRYLYNEKEIQNQLTNQYDYGARFYDPVIARWTTADPLAEVNRRWSTYGYVKNNPINRIDPDGMIDYIAGADEAANAAYKSKIAKEYNKAVGELMKNVAGLALSLMPGSGGSGDRDATTVASNNISAGTTANSGRNNCCIIGPRKESGETNQRGEKPLTHAQKLAKYGQISWGYNFTAGASISTVGGNVEMGTLVTNKGWARDYKTVYYSPGLASPSVSHSFFFVHATDGKNLPTFSDWNGLSKGVSGSFDFVAVGGGLGSNYAVWSLGLTFAPASLDFMGESRGSGALNVGVTTWLGPAYRLPGDGATQRYINTMKFQGGY